jgi:hypothetical protein
MTLFHEGIGQIHLAIKFERPCLHGQGARGGCGFGILIHKADFDPLLRKPERKNHAARPGTNDQNVNLPHWRNGASQAAAL